MPADWIWWGQLNTIAFNTEYSNSAAINPPADTPFVAVQLALAGVTIQDTTGFAWPNFTFYTDENWILHPLPDEPVTVTLNKPTSIWFMQDCQNAAALCVVTALGWE